MNEAKRHLLTPVTALQMSIWLLTLTMSGKKSKTYPLTLRQKLKLETELVRIKKTLAAEKRKYGAYDDSRGLRYLPTSLYIRLKDYSGGLKYLKWFSRNFPDDIGMPDFLFEWSMLLFKANKLKEAEGKLYQTFFSNTYLLDSFLGKPLYPIDKWEGSNLESPAAVQYLEYKADNLMLADFAAWLETLTNSESFRKMSEEYIVLHKKLKFETDVDLRSYLLARITQIEKSVW